MGAVDPAPTRSTAGRVIARIAVGVVVLVVVTVVFAFWNPWRLVVVERALFVPAVALVMAVVLAYAVAVMPLPADFTPSRRMMAVLTVPLMSLQMWGMAVPGWPTERPREVARSPDGQRVVVLHRTIIYSWCLSVWAGRGTGARVAGRLGDPGDEPVVTFDSRDLVVVWTDREPAMMSFPGREKSELRLDPATGRPLDKLRKPC